MESRLVLDTKALNEALGGPNGPVWRATLNACQQVKNAARAFAPVDQGGLRASIDFEIRREAGGAGSSVKNGPAGYVGSGLKYALYVHEGTGIYAKLNPKPIKPKSKPFLAWPIKNNSGAGRRRYKGGKTAGYAYAKQVKGVPGRPFLKKAVRYVFGRDPK